MEKNYKISVIIPVYNVEDYLEETIESVIEQTIGFENIQLILINDGSPDNSYKICEKYKELYPDNVVYVSQENAGVSEARNRGIKEATGELTTFLDSDDKWSKNSFKTVYNEYQKHNDIKVYSCQMQFFDAKKGNHALNYKYKENKIVNILEDYEYIQLSSSSLFVQTDALKGHKYDKNIKYSEDNKFINEIIFENPKTMMLKKPIYFYRKRINETSAIQNQVRNDSWYNVTPEKVYRYLFDLSKEKYGRVIEYIQFLVCYELSWRIAFNKSMDLSEKDREKYIKVLTSLIKEIDEEIILNNRFLNFNKKIFLLEVKEGKNIIDEIKYEEDYCILRTCELHKKTLGHIIIDQTYFKNGEMKMFGKLDQKYVSKKDFNIKKDEEEIEIKYYELTNDYNTETFNKEGLHDYIGFEIAVPVKENWNIKFYKNDVQLYPRFKRSSFFTEYLPASYHHYEGKTIVYKKNELINNKKNWFKTFAYEIKNDLKLIRKKKLKSLIARLYAKINFPLKRREIWLISDRVDKADDNGEHFFKYMIKNHPEVECYYVITKASVDYERVSKIGPIIDPNSNKYKLLIGIADYVVSSQAEDYVFRPLGNSSKYVGDQYYFKYIFLQHGIIKDDLSPWLNVNTKKMDMFVTSSQKEYDSLLECKYYYGPEIVKLTGLPRYDTLMEKQKKYKPQNSIMLSLTWRNSLAAKIDRKTGQRLYNPDFKKSSYFMFLNTLLNDKDVMKVLEEKNYKIRFIPHPNVLCQLEDFTLNKYVEVEKNSIDYQKEFCQNKLLITDYSSVFFDFGYLQKPILYYQEDQEEFFAGQLYDKGYFEYETMGFGPVHKEYDKFKENLIKIIKNDCKLDSKYEKRINDFFTFKDTKNSERVYNEIKGLK